MALLVAACFPDPPARETHEDALADAIDDDARPEVDDAIAEDIKDSVVAAETDTDIPTDGSSLDSDVEADVVFETNDGADEDGEADTEEVIVDGDSSPSDSDEDVPLTGCAAPGNDGTPCDDGDPCTVDDVCGDGACISGLPPDDSLGDWALAISEGPFVPTSMVVDRAGSPILSGFVDFDGGTLTSATGTLEFAQAGDEERVFVARIEDDGGGVISALSVIGQLASGETPLSLVATHVDALDHQALVVGRPDTIAMRSTSGDARTFSGTHETLLHARLEANGDIVDAVAWEHTGEGGAELLGSSRVGDAVWLTVHTSAPTTSIPTAFGTIELAPSDWSTEDPDRFAAVELASRSAHRAVQRHVDLGALPSLAVVPPPAGTDSLAVPSFLPRTITLESDDGPLELGPFAGLRLVSFGASGLVQTGLLASRPVLVDEVVAADFTPDVFFQAPFPRVLPRPDGGLFLLFRLRATRTFGDERNARTVTPTHGTMVIASYELGGRLAWARIVERPAGADAADPEMRWAAVTFLARADGALALAGGVDPSLRFERDDGSFAELTSSDGSRDGYLAQWDRAGRLVFALAVVSGPGRGLVSALAEDADGSLVIGGYAEGPTDMGVDGAAGMVDAIGTFGFAARLDSAGGLTCQ